MRNDMEPFKDKRVRRAIALCLDRPKLVQGLMKGRAKIGNDSPFAAVYPLDRQERAAAREGHRRGQAADGRRRHGQRLRDDADHREVSGNPGLRGADPERRQGDRRQDQSQRARPGRLLRRCGLWQVAMARFRSWASPTTAIAACRTCSCRRRCSSDGTWNAAHFKNTEYDQLVDQLCRALDLESQRAAAGKIQRLLLDETPVHLRLFLRLS